MSLEERQKLWQEILGDIHSRTGLSYRYMEFDTKDEAVAERVLPILADWVGRLADPNLRLAIFDKFGTPHARPFFSDLVDWWEREDNGINIDMLTGILAKLVHTTDAERLWAILQT